MNTWHVKSVNIYYQISLQGMTIKIIPPIVYNISNYCMFPVVPNNTYHTI